MATKEQEGTLHIKTNILQVLENKTHKHDAYKNALCGYFFVIITIIKNIYIYSILFF